MKSESVAYRKLKALGYVVNAYKGGYLLSKNISSRGIKTENCIVIHDTGQSFTEAMEQALVLLHEKGKQNDSNK